jgi:hypothetical protein
MSLDFSLFTFDETKYGSEQRLRLLLRDNTEHSNEQIKKIFESMDEHQYIPNIMNLLFFATQENNPQITIDMIDIFFRNIPDKSTRQSLVNSIAHIRLFKSIEQKKKNNVINDPRYHIYENNSNTIIKTLLNKYGLDIFKKYDSLNLLHLYGLANNVVMIQYILDIVLQTHPERLPYFLNEGDSQGRSPLLVSVAEGSEDAVKLLVEYGADIHLADLELRSAIWVAASFGNINIVKFLIDKGANVNQFSISGKSPAFMAQMYKDEHQSESSQVLDLLLENEGVIQGPVVRNGGKRKSRMSFISKRKTSKKGGGGLASKLTPVPVPNPYNEIIMYLTTSPVYNAMVEHMKYQSSLHQRTFTPDEEIRRVVLAANARFTAQLITEINQKIEIMNTQGITIPVGLLHLLELLQSRQYSHPLVSADFRSESVGNIGMTMNAFYGYTTLNKEQIAQYAIKFPIKPIGFVPL